MAGAGGLGGWFHAVPLGGSGGRSFSGDRGGSEQTNNVGGTVAVGGSGIAGGATIISVGGNGGTAGSNGTTGGIGGAIAGAGRGDAGSSSGGGKGGNAGGSGGSAGGSGGSANGGNGSGPLRITSARAFPAMQMAMVGVRVAVDSQDTAVVVGPSSTSNSGDDPGPTVTWIPTTGAMRKKTFANEPTPRAMAVDAADAVWLTGSLERPAAFGGTTVPASSFGYYLAKLGSDGSNLFTKAIVREESDTVWDGGYSITFDRDGNAYVVGILVLAAPEFHCAVLVNKFSPSGTLLADSVFHSTSAMQASANDAAIAPNGDLVVVGSFDETLEIGETKLTSASGQYQNGFVAILNAADLSPKQAFSFGGKNYYDGARAIDVTSTGALRVSGVLAGASSIGGKSVQAQTGGSAFIAELTAAGTANWVRLIQGDAQGIVWQTSTDANDRTFAVGSLVGGSSSALFAAIDQAGNLTFPVQLTGAGQNGALATAIDRHGGVWVALEGSGSSKFGNVPSIGASNDSLANWLVHIEP
jgi:hypothetical protein